MHVGRTILITFGLATIVACGDDAGEHDALAVAPLSTRPGCFSPIVTLAPCDEEEQPECKPAREANAAAQAQIESLTSPFVTIVNDILLMPNDELWQTTYEWPEPHELTTTFTVTAAQRGEPTGAFTIQAHDFGTFVPDGDIPMAVDGTRDLFGFYTPNFTMLDVGDGVLRWTAHALTAGSFYRGCDPNRGVSFDQRYLDDGTFTLFCWENDSGSEVDCNTIDLWPR